MITKPEITAIVAAATGTTQVKTREILDATFDTIAAALARSEKVQVAGFGVLNIKDTRERAMRNPRTGEPMIVPAGRKITFRPSNELRARAL